MPFSFRRSSLTPAASPGPAPLIQDGSYLEALGLRLNEAVSKALAHPSGPSLSSELVGGRRPIPAGRGHALGALIACELQAARDNTHLYRAILRSLHKPLSVLLSNLSALFLPVLSSPAFLRPSALTAQAATPNATQLHALAIADFAGELLSTFDDMALGIDTYGRGDGLKPIRAGLVSLIGRIVDPLIAGIKAELIPLIDALETPSNVVCHKVTMTGVVHPSITALQSCVPVYGRALLRYTSTHPSKALLASFLISIVWRALVALSHRPMMTRSSPQLILAEKGQYTPSEKILSATPTGLFKRGSSRPPSPVVTSTAAADAKALYRLFSHFPRPPAHAQAAREAVDEALVHLEALVSLLQAADDPLFQVNKTVEEIADEIHDLTDELPTLIALPVLLRMQHAGSVLGAQLGTVAALLNASADAYRRGCLAGFGRAEQCGPVVARRVLNAIYAQAVVDPSECLVDWLEARLCQSDR